MFCERINVFGGKYQRCSFASQQFEKRVRSFLWLAASDGLHECRCCGTGDKVCVPARYLYARKHLHNMTNPVFPKKITGCPTAFSSIASQHAFVAVLTHNPLHSGRSVTTVGLVDRTQTNNGSLAAVWHILSSDFRVCPVEWINVLLRSIASRTSTFLSLTASNLNTVNLFRTTWTPQQTAVSVREEVCTACKAWKDFIRCESAEWKWKWRLQSCCYSIFNNTNIK